MDASEIQDLKAKVATHEGELRGFRGLTAALQTSFGLMTAAVIGVGTLLVGGIAVVAAFQVSDNGKLDAHGIALAELKQSQSTMSGRLDSIDGKLSVLVTQAHQKAR
jgi:hypothetical protein